MPEALRSAVLIAATLATGVMAGVFGLYSHTIMRGLGRTDDRTFVGAFQAIDNDGLKAAGDPDRIPDLAAVRERFNEAKWNHWNHVRALMTTAAFGCLAWALVLNGRITTP
jgi:uncharacterized membrane protein